MLSSNAQSNMSYNQRLHINLHDYGLFSIGDLTIRWSKLDKAISRSYLDSVNTALQSSFFYDVLAFF